MSHDDVYKLKDKSYIEGIRDQIREQYEDVYQTALGPALEGGERVDEPAIHVYVDRKLREEELDEEDIAPRRIDGVRVDVRGVNRENIKNDQGSPLRYERSRPIMGGLRLERDDGIGGTGQPVLDSGGNPAYLTNHHIVDDNGTVETSMYQPELDINETDDNIIGSPTDWDGDKDWALITLDDVNWHTSLSLGIGSVTQTTSTPSFEQRVILNGARYGLLGGDLIAIDIDQSGRTDFEYAVDENVDTSGMSGSYVGQVQGDNSFDVFALHTSSSTTSNSIYGSSIDVIQSQSGFTFSTDAPTTPDVNDFSTSEHFELTVVDHRETTQREVDIRVVNAGGGSATQTIKTGYNGTIYDSQAVTLNAFESTTITLEWPTVSGYIKSEDDEWIIDLSEYFDEQEIRNKQFGDIYIPWITSKDTSISRDVVEKNFVDEKLQVFELSPDLEAGTYNLFLNETHHDKRESFASQQDAVISMSSRHGTEFPFSVGSDEGYLVVESSDTSIDPRQEVREANIQARVLLNKEYNSALEWNANVRDNPFGLEPNTYTYVGFPEGVQLNTQTPSFSISTFEGDMEIYELDGESELFEITGGREIAEQQSICRLFNSSGERIYSDSMVVDTGSQIDNSLLRLTFNSSATNFEFWNGDAWEVLGEMDVNFDNGYAYKNENREIGVEYVNGNQTNIHHSFPVAEYTFSNLNRFEFFVNGWSEYDFVESDEHYAVWTDPSNPDSRDIFMITTTGGEFYFNDIRDSVLMKDFTEDVNNVFVGFMLDEFTIDEIVNSIYTYGNRRRTFTQK